MPAVRSEPRACAPPMLRGDIRELALYEKIEQPVEATSHASSTRDTIDPTCPFVSGRSATASTHRSPQLGSQRLEWRDDAPCLKRTPWQPPRPAAAPEPQPIRPAAARARAFDLLTAPETPSIQPAHSTRAKSVRPADSTRDTIDSTCRSNRTKIDSTCPFASGRSKTVSNHQLGSQRLEWRGDAPWLQHTPQRPIRPAKDGRAHPSPPGKLKIKSRRRAWRLTHRRYLTFYAGRSGKDSTTRATPESVRIPPKWA